MQRGNVMILKSNSREWLKDAFENGMLTGEAERHCIRVLREDEAIRRENAYLHGIIRSQRATIKSFQDADLAAKKYEFERREGHRMGRGFRWIVGVSLTMLGVAMISTIYSMVAIWWM